MDMLPCLAVLMIKRSPLLCLKLSHPWKLRFYLFDRARYTARERTQAGGVGEGEAVFPLSREPDAGLDPRTLGS